MPKASKRPTPRRPASRGRKPNGSPPRTLILNVRISVVHRKAIEHYATVHNLTLSTAAVALIESALRRDTKM